MDKDKMCDLDTNENIYHITWVTHNSRTSERMVRYKVKKGEPLLLTDDHMKEITGYIGQIIVEDGLKVIRYIVNSDHVHLILITGRDKRDNIIRKIKGKSTQLFKINHKINETLHLWAQKYNSSIIKSDKELETVINYVEHNESKHEERT